MALYALEALLSWYTFSTKIALPPTRPHLLIHPKITSPIVSQVFKYMNVWNHSHSSQHKYAKNSVLKFKRWHISTTLILWKFNLDLIYVFLLSDYNSSTWVIQFSSTWPSKTWRLYYLTTNKQQNTLSTALRDDSVCGTSLHVRLQT